ncbi:MAG: cell division protein FtsL [Eggerthellaceae bacterium]|nr:cell division protein FtsL [Eggerthellaceae bacterium]
MASAERAYRYDAYPDYAPERSRRADVRAIRTGSPASTDSNAALLVTAAKLAAVVLVFVACLSFARIALTNAAVTTMIESDALSAQIAEARSSGVSLEMEQSVLSSTSALNAAVKRLGMAAPGAVGTLALEPDVVATDANGELLLSDSVKNVVNARS